MTIRKPFPEDFWNYLSIPQQDLLIEGAYLKDQIIEDAEYSFKDYSFLVFPFAKSYEGFLKQLFLDVGFITHLDYISNHFRIGKMLSPNMKEKLGEKSLYIQIERSITTEFAEEVWTTWKLHRNEIFHYFPHNIKAITYAEADTMIKVITHTMHDCYKQLLLPLRPNPPLRGLDDPNAEEDVMDRWKRTV